MQVSPWANGQCLQDGQLQSTHSSPHLNHNTRSNNNGFGNNASRFVHQNTGVGALVGHYKLYNGVMKPAQSAGKQRPNNYLPLNNPLPPSTAQSLPNRNHSYVNLNTTYCPIAQFASFSGKLPSTVPSNVMHYYRQGIVNYGLNQNAQIANSTSSSSPQTVYITQQQPVNSLNQTTPPSQTCSQISQQTSLPSYSEAVFHIGRTKYLTSNEHNEQNVLNDTPLLVATSCVNLAATNNQSEQNSHLLSQTNEIHAAQTVNKHMPLLTQMLMTNNTSNSAACLQTQTNSQQNQEHLQQPTIRGKGDMQTVYDFPPKSITLTANGNNSLKTTGPSVMLSAQTSLPESTNATSGFQNIRTNTPTKDQLLSILYQKINGSKNWNQCASISQSSHIGHVSQVSQVNRYEGFDKIDTVSVFQANDGSVHTSPGRVPRAVAVVPPLAQESPSSKLASPNTHPSLKPVPSPNQLETLPIATSDTTWSRKISHIPVENAGNVQAASPSQNEMQADLYDRTKRAAMSQSCSQVIEGSIQSAKLSKRRSSSANRKTPTEENPCEKDLSSLPTTEWTLDKLCAIIQEMEKNDKNNDYEVSANQVMHGFWGANGKAGINAWYKELITEVNKFCSEIDLNGVILTQMKSLSTKHRVLQHDEVYQEESFFTSTWFNNNSQLDDIEKEFGFPWYWKYQECGSSSDSTSAETHSKLKDKSHTELDQSDVHSEDDSSYSFKIEVLPSDEARAIFEQTQCKTPQRVDTSLPEGNVSSENTDKPENISKKETCHASTIDVVCCIEKWKEKVFGLSTESKCKCQELKQEHSDDKSHQSMTNVIADSTKNDSTPVFALKEENIQENQNNKTNIIVISESEDNSEDQVSNPTDDENDLGDLLEPAESHPVASTNKNKLETKMGNDCNVNTSEKLLLLEECRMELVKTPEDASNSAPAAFSTLFSPSDESQEGDIKLQVDSHDLLSQQKFKLPSHLKAQTIFESFSKSKNNASVKCVELLLFGSAQQEKCSSVSTRRSRLQFPDSFPEKMQQPPRRLSVKLGPSKRISEADSLGDISVKRRIHENWRKSFSPTTIKLRRKNKKFVVISPAKTNSPQKKKKRKISDTGDNQCHKRKRSRCDGKTDQSGNVQVFKKPANDEIQPHQENALKFNVLPSTFSFKEGSNNSDRTIDTEPDEKTGTVSPEAKDKQPVKKTIGTWREDSSKNHPVRSPAISETKNVFQEFQKRYKMMTQT